MIRFKSDSHVHRVSIIEATSALEGLNPELSRMLADLPPSFPLFIAEYPYGSLILGPHGQDDHFGHFIPPCGVRGICGDCQDLSQACGDALPLSVVLNNSAEEFLEYNESTVNFGHPRLTVPRRFLPTRLVYAGQMLGLIEVLNRLTAPKYNARAFNAPVRHASAGARSCFVSLSFRADDLFHRIIKLTPADAFPSEGYRKPATLRHSCANDNWLLLKLLHRASGGTEQLWSTRVLLLPSAPLNDFLQAATRSPAASQDLAFYLFSKGWQQSRGLRSEHIRQISLADSLADEPDDSVADHTIQRLLLILRGDAPGFAAANISDELGPFTHVQKFFLESGLKEAAEQEFLPIISPMHFGTGSRRSSYFYLSASVYPILGPIGEVRSRIKLLERIHDRLTIVRSNNPGLLEAVKIDYYVSELSEGIKKRREKEGNPSISNINMLLNSLEIARDFRDQLSLAAQYHSREPGLSFAIRPGFLTRFMRISEPGRASDVRRKSM